VRAELLYNPRLLCERLAVESIRRRRIARLHGTPAQNLSSGHIDSLELLELAQRYRDISCIYDVGANVGTWTLLAKAVIPGAQVCAFEPLPRHADAFLANVAAVDGVTLHRIGLGRENKETVLRVTDFSDASSVLPLAPASRSHFGLSEVEEVPIELCRLDDYRLAQGLPFPDLIKLDVQGYELDVLSGGLACVKFAKAIIAEVSFLEFYQNQCLFADVMQFMTENGFCLHALGVNTPLGNPLLQTDALFIAR
jgi:FkbM family methyltransferase